MTTANDYAEQLKDEYNILAPNVTTMARKFSGGNLQKVILAREISSAPTLMVAVQPTRGLDVGAIEAIQKIIIAAKRKWNSCLINFRRAGRTHLLV